MSTWQPLVGDSGNLVMVKASELSLEVTVETILGVKPLRDTLPIDQSIVGQLDGHIGRFDQRLGAAPTSF